MSLIPAGILVWIACLSLFAQQQGPAPPPPGRPRPRPRLPRPRRLRGRAVRPAPQIPAGRGRPGAPDPDAGADFSPKPPIKALTPEEQAARFILPPGYRMELVLADPDIVNPTAIAFDGNGRLYVNEMRSYMLDADGSRELRADQPHQRAREHEGRRPVRPPLGLHRQARAAPLRASARQGQHPDDGDQHGRHFQVHRHQRRRRGGEEGAVLQRRRPAREPRAPAERVRLGARQLDLQHLQRLPHPLDAERDSQGADRPQQRPVGADAGRQREDVVRRCRRRAGPDELPGAHRLRLVQRRAISSSRAST